MAASAGLALLLVVLFAVLRVAPIWRSRHRGCDAYYFLMCAQSLRARRRLPIELPPWYLLEGHRQLYPPGFAILLALLPRRLVERYYWAINHTVDLLVAVAIGWWTGATFGTGWGAVALVAYAASPFLVLEFSNLSSRPPAVVLFLLVIATTWQWTQEGGPWVAAAVVAWWALLYTHKLTVQLLWFLVPYLALTLGDARWLVPMAAGYAVAFAMAPRYFLGLLRAHADIVAFWSRQWRYLGAHQVRNSPVYGDASPAGFHSTGWLRSVLVHVRRTVQYNPWAPLALWAAVRLTLTGTGVLALHWLVGTYIWAALTLGVPRLRGLGEGTKYIKFALAPSLFLSTAVLADSPDALAWALAAFGLVVTVGFYVRIAGEFRHASHGAGIASPDLDAVIDRLREEDGARVMCVPTHVADLVAYAAHRPVLWGTHHYGFREVEPFFPVLREPVEWFVARYGLTHLLLDTTYAAPAELGMQDRPVLAAGRYSLLPLAAGAADSRASHERRSEIGPELTQS